MIFSGNRRPVQQVVFNLCWGARWTYAAHERARQSLPKSLLVYSVTGKAASEAWVGESLVPAAVLDTNVVLDWLVFRDAGVAPIAQAVRSGRLHWLATDTMRDELAHMLGHSCLSGWSPDVKQALAAFDLYSRSCPDAPASRLHCSDPDDQPFIDLALAHRVPWLITHDRALLKLARRARQSGVAVLRPIDWRSAWPLQSTSG